MQVVQHNVQESAFRPRVVVQDLRRLHEGVADEGNHVRTSKKSYPIQKGREGRNKNSGTDEGVGETAVNRDDSNAT